MPTAHAPTKQKTAGKTAGKPFTPGVDARRGAGKKGRSGRKPDEWKERLRAIVSSDEVLDQLETVLKNKDHAAYVGALKFAASYGYGQPQQSVELTGKDGGPIEVKQVWMFGDKQVQF